MHEVKIEKLDHQGRGICYIEKKVTFVPHALPEEIVDIKIKKETKKYNIAELVKIKEHSEKRQIPFCPYYQACGGCSLQTLSYEDTLQYKKEKLENILNRNALQFPEIEMVANKSPKNYRNKITLKIKKKKIGFYQEETHDLIEVNACMIASTTINNCIKQLSKLNIENGSVTIRCNYNDEILIIINTEDKINFNESLFTNLKVVGVILNDQTIYGENFFYERIRNCLFKVSYDAFFQVNPFITKKLFELIENNVKKATNVLDLYAGVGTLGIIASQNAEHVYSIEIVKNAVLDNMLNRKLNKRANIEVFLGDAGKVLEKIKVNFDTIIIDPPRSGLSTSALKIIMSLDAEQVLYISCDPQTLARDLKKLTEKYDIQKLYALDMFSYTYHVECVCVLNYRKPL